MDEVRTMKRQKLWDMALGIVVEVGFSLGLTLALCLLAYVIPLIAR